MVVAQPRAKPGFEPACAPHQGSSPSHQLAVAAALFRLPTPGIHTPSLSPLNFSPQINLAVCRFMDATGYGSTSDAVQCLDW